MNPVRQKWIYTFFMYPFLSGGRVEGKRPVKLPCPSAAAAAVLNGLTYELMKSLDCFPDYITVYQTHSKKISG